MDGYYGIYKYIIQCNAELHCKGQKCVKTWIRITKVSLIHIYYPVIQIKSGKQFIAYHW